jgi:hypothetical protein
VLQPPVGGDTARRRSANVVVDGRRPVVEAQSAALPEAIERIRCWDKACSQAGRAWRRSGSAEAHSSGRWRKGLPCSWQDTSAGLNVAGGGHDDHVDRDGRHGPAGNAGADRHGEAEDQWARGPYQNRPAPAAQPADAPDCSSCRRGCVVLWLLR